jgi:hypothetical protein
MADGTVSRSSRGHRTILLTPLGRCLCAGRRRPGRVSAIARRGLPDGPRTLPAELRPGLCVEGRTNVGQAGGADPPHPPAGRRRLQRPAVVQRLRRLREWARRRGIPAWLLEQVEKLCGRSKEYAEAYSHPGGHRTSNMLDLAMRGMNRCFDRGQHLHGSPAACRLHCRAWALLANYAHWHPAVARTKRGMAMPRRTPQPPSRSRRLAPEPARLRLPRRLPVGYPPPKKIRDGQENL